MKAVGLELTKLESIPKRVAFHAWVECGSMKQHPAHVCSIDIYSAALSPANELMGSLGQDERKGKRRKPNLFNVVEEKTRK